MDDGREKPSEIIVSVIATGVLVVGLLIAAYWLAYLSWGSFQDAAAPEFRRTRGEIGRFGLMAGLGALVCLAGALTLAVFTARYYIGKVRKRKAQEAELEKIAKNVSMPKRRRGGPNQ